MDKCFKGTESFIAVYIDDILVYSKNENEHAKHLEKMLKICEDNGLVLSPTKMKIAVSTIDFLGAVIGEGTIKLPLYEKTNAHGDKRLKSSDYELVKKIKEQVQNLLDLEIPPENAYIVLETDGCMERWGGIVKWKKSKGEVTLRTDCQAIISFYNKTNSNKSSRVGWIKFADAVTGTSVKINIEHIEGKHNTLADSLLRLVNLCFAECTGEMKELAVAALYSVEEVLQSPNAFQKNMKITCEEITTSLTEDKTSEFKTKKQEESLLNWKPLPNDWAATTSKLKEVQPNNPEENMYRYNRKGFLEDDDSSDDSIFIVDPGWDDYCLQELKLNRPVPLCPEARRARM
ncbi:ORFIII-like polyprotein [Tanacetum coccineum]